MLYALVTCGDCKIKGQMMTTDEAVEHLAHTSVRSRKPTEAEKRGAGSWMGVD